MEIDKTWEYSEVRYFRVICKNKPIYVGIDKYKSVAFIKYEDKKKKIVSRSSYGLTEYESKLIIGFILLHKSQYTITTSELKEAYVSSYRGYSRSGSGGYSGEMSEMDEIYSDFH